MQGAGAVTRTRPGAVTLRSAMQPPVPIAARVRLTNLARRTLGALERAATEMLPTPAVLNAALLASLRSVAAGDLTFRNLVPVSDTHEGEALGRVVHRVRALVTLGRASLGRGGAAAERVERASTLVAELAGRQQVVLERAAEDVGRLTQRAGELATLADEVADAADRAALLSLNAGIEGMRVGGETARALTALGDEIRRLAQRAAGGATELAGGVRELGRTADAAVRVLTEARATASGVGEEATRAAASADAARRSDRDLAAALEGYALLDDETEALVAGIAAASDRLARDVRDARARLGEVEPGARAAIEAALDRLRLAMRGDGA